MTKQDENEDTLTPILANWLAVIRACEKSGEALKSCAARKGLSIHSLYQAKRALREKGILQPPVAASKNRQASSGRSAAKPRFSQVVRRIGEDPSSIPWRLRLPTGLVFESHAPLAVDDVVRLARGLGGAS